MTGETLDPTAKEALRFLWGARAQRIDGPEATLLVFTMYERGVKQCLLLSWGETSRGVGVVSDRPTGQPASTFVRQLRVSLENARLTSAHWLGVHPNGASASALTLSFERSGEHAVLALDFDRSNANAYLLNSAGFIVRACDEKRRRSRFAPGRQPFSPSPHGKVRLISTDAEALELGRALTAGASMAGEETARRQVAAQVKASLKRLERKAGAIRDDLARCETVPLLRREANALLCALAAIPKGATQVELEDVSADPPEPFMVSLDPALSANENVERRFARARRLERGVAIARERLRQVEAEIERLRSFATAIETEDMDALLADAEQLGIRVAQAQTAGAKRRTAQVRTPYRVFIASGGLRVLVGKGAEDNDTLTLTVARPHDIWLHARGMHGAHVVVSRERDREVPPETLLDAAHLAAHFSDARGEPSVEVQHVERRYIRKPKGIAKGEVRVDRERVLLLRVEPARLQRLLSSEIAP